MTIAKEDIKPGHYWVYPRGLKWLTVVLVRSHKTPRGAEHTLIWPHGRESAYLPDEAFEFFDFIARIEPPEGV
jgi:hypothetical protein